jgi:hypothetical protein
VRCHPPLGPGQTAQVESTNERERCVSQTSAASSDHMSICLEAGCKGSPFAASGAEPAPASTGWPGRLAQGPCTGSRGGSICHVLPRHNAQSPTNLTSNKVNLHYALRPRLPSYSVAMRSTDSMVQGCAVLPPPNWVGCCASPVHSRAWSCFFGGQPGGHASRSLSRTTGGNQRAPATWSHHRSVLHRASAAG